MNEYSGPLSEAVALAREKEKKTQREVADDLHIDVRTVLNIENRRGNPKLSILYPLVRYLNIDPYRIFYSTSKHISPARQQLHQLIDTCTDEEVELLLPIHRDVIFALRNNSKKNIK